MLPLTWRIVPTSHVLHRHSVRNVHATLRNADVFNARELACRASFLFPFSHLRTPKVMQSQFFAAASLLCGASHTLTQFTLMRILQGVGGAMMVPVGRLIVLRTARPKLN